MNDSLAVADVTVGPDGRVFASTRGGIVVESPPDEADFVAGRVFVADGTGGLRGGGNMAFGPDGNLYVGSDKAVLRFDGTTGTSLGTFLTTPAGFGSLGDLAFDARGDLLVVNGRSSIARFDGTTGASLGTFAAGNGATFSGIAVGVVPEPAVASVAASGVMTLRRRRR